MYFFKEIKGLFSVIKLILYEITTQKNRKWKCICAMLVEICKLPFLNVEIVNIYL